MRNRFFIINSWAAGARGSQKTIEGSIMNTTDDLTESDWLIFGDSEICNYLFVAGDSSQPIFHGIQEEMAQLNDFCFLSLQSTSNRVKELEQKAKRFRSGEERLEDPNLGDVSSEVAWGIEEFEIPRWKDTEQFMVRAMCLVLLSAFLEKSLKELALYLSDPESVRFKKKSNLGEIASLLIYLKEVCRLEFKEPEASEIAREKCRTIRNDFAHGHWMKVKDNVANYSLSAAFGAVTALMEVIDKASEIQS
jgi:hypothetical protein